MWASLVVNSNSLGSLLEVARVLHERLGGTVCILGRILEKDWVEYCGLTIRHMPEER